MNDNISTITKRFRILLDERKMTREEFAKVLDCDTSLITKYYNGQREIPTKNIVKIAEYFGVTTDYLLGAERCKNHEFSQISLITHLNENSIKILSSDDNTVARGINKILAQPQSKDFFDNISDLCGFAFYAEYNTIQLNYAKEKNLKEEFNFSHGDVLKYLDTKGMGICNKYDRIDFYKYKLSQNLSDIMQGIVNDVKEIDENGRVCLHLE